MHKNVHKNVPKQIGNSLHRCEICGLNFSFYCNMSKVYFYKIPSKGFNDINILERHMKMHDIGKFKCDSCKVRFTGVQSLERHKILAHSRLQKNGPANGIHQNIMVT